MSRPIIPRPALTILLALALLLPICVTVLYLVGLLLQAMQDAAGVTVVGYLVLAAAVAWLVDMVALVIALAITTLGPPE